MSLARIPAAGIGGHVQTRAVETRRFCAAITRWRIGPAERASPSPDLVLSSGAPNMPKPILVGVDPLRDDAAPLALGAALARIAGVPLVALAAYLHDPITNAVSGGMVEDDLRSDALRKLEAMTGGTDADLLVAGGHSPARVLQDAAVRLDAGLIVVGSTAKCPPGRIMPGSTAERLLHGAPCPVAIAPTGLGATWRPCRIGAAFVDSEESRVALRAAAALSRTAGAPLHAMTAVEPLEWGRSAAIAPYLVDGRFETSTASARRALDDAIASIAVDVPTTGEVVVARVVEALKALSRDVDLLVCGSRGYGPLRAVLLGGVTHRLTREAECPVIVVPRGIEAPFGALGERSGTDEQGVIAGVETRRS
jgi:nucleotide-binding universal stress UspA family protein